MTAAIVNHLWQSTVGVLVAALLAVALRHNRAGVRHAVWLAASLKFLVPFALLISLGGAFSWRTSDAPVVLPTSVASTVQAIAEPFAEPPASVPVVVDAPARSAMPWGLLLGSAWLLGSVVVIGMRLRGWATVRAALRASTPVALDGTDDRLRVRATPGLLEPGVVGIWRPVLLVPVGLESILAADQLRAVVLHEVHHVERRDNLSSALHMVVEAAFWFHPLVWWVGRRLVDERERACDEYVLATGAAVDAYAEGILNVCKRYVEQPVACVAGVTGSDLKRRVGAILTGHVGVGLSGPRRVMVTSAALAALAAPLAAGVITAPLRPYSQASGPVPKFEVVSVRPCDAATPGPGRSGNPAGVSAGRLDYRCGSLLELIGLAYDVYAGGRVHAVLDRPVMPRPGDVPPTRAAYSWPASLPEWIWRDRFAIEAKAEGYPSMAVLLGPMLQSLLEDKFKLKVHRETREVPTYELVVAKGGSKLKPAEAGSCVPYDFSLSPQPAPPVGQHRCDASTHKDSDGNFVDEAEMMTLDEFFAAWGVLSRPIVNKTGITGPVAIRFVQPHSAGSDDAVSAVIGALRDQLGLDLRPGKDPLEFLVIDSAERPATAEPAASAARPTQATAARPNFDVASIRPCEGGGGTRGGGSGPGGGPAYSPERLYLPCITPQMLIELAYVLRSEADNGGHSSEAFANWPTLGLNNDDGAKRIRGGPSWMYDERYTLEAKAEGVTTEAQRNVMVGPMLRALLEDRFKLRMHEGTEQAPMYAMTVVKAGLKIAPMKNGECAPHSSSSPSGRPLSVADAAAAHLPPTCQFNLEGPDGPNWRYQLSGLPLERLAGMLSADLGVKVVDETGVTDRFLFTWAYGPDDRTPGPRRRLDVVNGDDGPTPTAPDVFAALQEKLGLQLDPITATRAFLAVDQIERPSIGQTEAPPRERRQN